jgi:purine-binding chemotaxis protein CheW
VKTTPFLGQYHKELSLKVMNEIPKEFNALVFTLNSEVYALPVEQTLEVIDKKEFVPIPNSPYYIEGMINLRGKAVVIFNLAKRLKLKEQDSAKAKKIIIVNTEKTLFGILVDDVRDIKKIDSSNIQTTPEIVANKLGKEYILGIGFVQTPVEKPLDPNETIESLTSDPETKTEALLILDLLKILKEVE